ncbi:murein biosynthesis integral membrane protein MurJ [Microcoleus sp. FACHB-1515]|uniref:murein biosynthesis integral membrane protein MurJ n=1 Tax=Cyanophyceae TaxID=3028117 RepID=UPI001683A2FB|nr:murein biosynthesis integral membrane protein MurJ [Microcoleus sp. FACHB-1515]MBD2088774.1 murein biosynthesis integral membrane protein MurJ [Microcoleus sp. FACHB-1515]
MSDSKKPTRSLVNIAAIVAIATLISKFFGLFRQQAIAAAFGTGAAYGAYNFAYVIPGFLLILLGGINGPFHSAIVSVLAKRNKAEVAPIVESITTLVVGILLLVAIAIAVFADPLLHLTAPGLEADARSIAVSQLRIMAPMAVFAGLIGIGFGALNADDQYWLPSISPLLSSVTTLIGLGGLALYLGGDQITAAENAALGGAVLAWSTLAGAVLQWVAQLPSQWRSGLGGLRLRFNFRQPEVQQVIKIMGPAVFSSGMMQINVATDLFFITFIPDATAAVSALGYAGLLVQTPLGIVSNVILVPLMPIFARLTAPENWPELKTRIRQGLMLTAFTMMPISALMIALAVPIARVVYERGAFDTNASYLTASVLMAYAIGMFFYLGRDVLVRVFYALEDADTPFRISVVNIFLNALFDFLLVWRFGAAGIVLATVSVNVISMVALLIVLHRKLGGLPWREWSFPIAFLALGSVAAGFASWFTWQGLTQFLGSANLLIQVAELGTASAIGAGVFLLFATRLQLPEVQQFIASFRRRLFRR